MMDPKESVIQYNEIFVGDPWFGDSIMKSLEHIPVGFWDKKPEKASHSISELVYHIIGWRNFVIEKLKGNKEFTIELNSENDWRKDVVVQTEMQKEDTINELGKTQNMISKLLLEIPESKMNEKVAGGEYTNKYMIRGVLQHDVYHLGQINMIYSQLK
ncbi:DinB family protein [Aquimarina aquimarini]|uniref:DinB family protein n=1 Tax=Aquimarina aquimarini TaxID=1191734 RepID=UPI000D55A1B5|nr:DinB family protein [Aquimarina aquimarini]